MPCKPYAIPFALGFTPVAIMVPVTCVPWSDKTDALSFCVTLFTSSTCVVKILPPSQTPNLFFTALDDPDKLSPDDPPGHN